VKSASTLTGSEKQAAALAVSRYGADRARVDDVVQEVLRAKAQGRAADLLGALISARLLTASQAQELGRELGPARTAHTPPALPTASTPTPDAPFVLSPSGQQLRSIGPYRLLRRLGQGGMGSVYLAYEEGANRPVAIKVLSEQLASSQPYVERFYREAKSGSHLDHPNIVRFRGAGYDAATDKHYLVMEYVDGPSAHALLDRAGRLSVGDAVHIALDIARGLEHAHSRNVVHRDIKPDNVLTTQSGVAKLADLGLAKRLDEVSHLTGFRVGFGTVDYIPYEQAINAKQADARSDIFALGATLYHLVTGEVPFPAKNSVEVTERKERGDFVPAGALNPDVPPALDRILARMLARDPRDRYQMASELIVDLVRSELAAAVPSFADPNRALEDPLVRAQLTTPAPPTQLDVQTQANQQAAANGNPDVWYLRFRNREGQWIKTKMTTRQVADRLGEGRIGAHVEAAREPRGEFRPLAVFPEFRELVASRPPSGRHPAVEPAASAAPGMAAPRGGPAGRRAWWVIAAAGVALLGAAATAYWLLF
jgi:serine/threonine-protein kinase